MTMIPRANQVDGMGTALQFQVVTTQPEREATFREWQSKSRAEGGGAGDGSFVAFHGSSIANWHSILRTGLRGGPGAVGTGVYMADQLAYSIPYMKSQDASRLWKNSELGCDGGSILSILPLTLNSAGAGQPPPLVARGGGLGC
jgi:ubiquitin-conjugating enzyme E2 Q